MIKIYGQLRSRAPRCLWALEELGLPYEHIPVNPMAGEAQKPEFLEINPNGKVPALVDGDLKLCESMAINLYLARRYDAGKGLWPQAEEDQARALQWSFWGMTEIEPPFITLLVQKVFAPEDQRKPDREQEARAALPRPLKVLDAHLAERPYLLGERFTIADLNLASILTLATLLDYDLAAYRNVKRWLDVCLARPAYRQVMSRAA